ncbi:hypothetical protein EAF04_007686 [Stromatinia cepivora]|nr:hypothetical protein EAF04_007686 [Stromatinia cepivora]
MVRPDRAGSTMDEYHPLQEVLQWRKNQLPSNRRLYSSGYGEIWPAYPSPEQINSACERQPVLDETKLSVHINTTKYR